MAMDVLLKPNIEMKVVNPVLLVNRTGALFADSATTVNNASVLVNDPTALVGGSDSFTWSTLLSGKIGNDKPIITL